MHPPASPATIKPPPSSGSIYDTITSRSAPSLRPFHPLTSDPLTAPSSKSSPSAEPRFRAATDPSGLSPTNHLGALVPLPFPLFWQPGMPAGGGPPPDYGWLSSHCGLRSGIGIVGGGVMGLGMGVFLGAMADMSPPVTVYRGFEVPLAPVKEQAMAALRSTGEKSLYWCRNFAFITGVFSGSECVVEKLRGRTDIWNPTISGCITGAMLQAKAGPSSAAFGCIGFASFSIVIEQFMGTHS
ncbi:hypothetical protein TeGR_g8410 [Tetraparma gracilis]|uniref:Mitochondrial import inner membrane translocase subunit TIM22 n=1 Tax=Tetraparma gracilis TaxID=2962635 RepID=A0ABQ6M9Y1_9STRA|nr:hypothetical protein TeGR_g8410 [Tetraparma gracilis]